MAASSALSDTLKSITVTKIKELDKQRSSYEGSRNAVLAAADEAAQHGPVNRLVKLLHGVKAMSKDSTYATSELHNIECWLDQARYDPAVPSAKLNAVEATLRARLEVGSRKLDLAHLYSRLLTEWIEKPTSSGTELSDPDAADSEDSFDVVEDRQKARLVELRDKFARVVFEPLQTDEVEIDNYLRTLFPDDHGSKALSRLRRGVAQYGQKMLDTSFQIDDQHLRWSIKALLKNQLLNDEKRASLNDFLKDEAVLKEIQDVVNMRLRDLKAWDWDLGGEGVPVVPRQGLNGKWRVTIEDDTLHAILTHFVGTMWAVRVKRLLRDSRVQRKLWRNFTVLSEKDQARRQYFAHYTAHQKCLAQERQQGYDKEFFMAALPDKFSEVAGGYDDDEEKLSDDKKSPKDTKQLMLRTIANDTLLRRMIDGEVAVLQSDFQWFATGIAHSTIFAVMRFVGFQEEWISFFRKVLEPPLDMLDGSPVRIRKRGLPMAHIFEKLLGELVLYFMDLAVAQNDGMILYRLHDDLYLSGKPQQVAESWKTMTTFSTVMGLEFNMFKTGSAYLTTGDRTRDPTVLSSLPKGDVAVYFLRLNPDTGHWEVNQEHVQEHVSQLKKQLDESKNVLQWIKTWNSCIGRFFGYTLGEPAFCFGEEHIDATLETHGAMQRQLFPDSTVTEHVKSMIAAHFPDFQTPIPDAFINMPEAQGGLGLKNPFISLLMVKKGMHKSTRPYEPFGSYSGKPDFELKTYLDVERKAYEHEKKAFLSLSERDRHKRYKECFPADDHPDKNPPLSWTDAQTFMSFEEYTAHRELTSVTLHNLYEHLLKQPRSSGVQMSSFVKNALQRLEPHVEGLSSSGESDPEMLWTVQGHEDELRELFRGIEVVNRGVLPVGVLGALKARQVVWQMVL